MKLDTKAEQALQNINFVERYEAFGFVPLLALGVFKDVKHLNRVKIYEHILLIAQLAGNIG